MSSAKVLGYLRKHPRLLVIVGGGLGLVYNQRTSSRAMTHDLGVIIDSAYEKLGESLALQIHTMGTGLKVESAGTQPTGPASSHPMIQAASREHSAMQSWAAKIKRCTTLGGGDCPRLMRIAASYRARIGRKK
ncbi:hypothetical protein B9Z19DRAFT_1137285 [Tuber borchii]|uniref:Uncharacterized protein n=1 Tax=Tuber borchii TaxID=42251 RepID=A0A2T6ZAM6_TUBBO|nr:hypothetical protein B9Z19DRAFT_1137285 [Tuber borchii]